MKKIFLFGLLLMPLLAQAGEFTMDETDYGYRTPAPAQKQVTIQHPDSVEESDARTLLESGLTEKYVNKECPYERVNFIKKKTRCAWDDYITYTTDGSVVQVTSSGAGKDPAATTKYSPKIILWLLSVVCMVIAVGIVLVVGINTTTINTTTAVFAFAAVAAAVFAFVFAFVFAAVFAFVFAFAFAAVFLFPSGEKNKKLFLIWVGMYGVCMAVAMYVIW